MTWAFCQVMTVWLYFWSSFVKEMHIYFGIPDIVAEAAHSLNHLRMNSDNQIATYNIAFLQYSTMLQWIENALCHRYYFGLPDRIQDIISTHEGSKPSTFWSLYSTAVFINNHFWEQKCKSKRAPYSTPQCPVSLESSESVSNLSLSDSNSNVGASESSDKFPTWRHTPSLDLSDSVSKLSLSSVSDSGSIVSTSTSTLFPTPLKGCKRELHTGTNKTMLCQLPIAY